MKKILAMLLAATLTLSLTACGGDTSSGSEANGGDGSNYKIAIITGTMSQGEEEFQAAKKLQDKNPGKIVTATYPDNFTKEQETTISNTINLVSDPDVKGLVFLQAVPGASAAIQKAKEINPELIVVAGVVQEDPGVISAAADVVLNTDEIGMGVSIPRQAAAQGAKVLIHYSFPRHLAMQNISVRLEQMKAECEKLGLEFVQVDAPDPLGDSGVTGTQQFIKEDVPKQLAKYGKDTAFFGTNCAMQEQLIKAVAEGGAILPQQCCPSPYHGYPGAFAIEIPEDKAGDVNYVLEATSAKIAEIGNSGRMSTWPVPVNMMFVDAGVKYIEGRLDGSITDANEMEALEKICEEIAGADITMDHYDDGATVYDNMYIVLSDYYTYGGLPGAEQGTNEQAAEDGSSSQAEADAADQEGEASQAA